MGIQTTLLQTQPHSLCGLKVLASASYEKIIPSLRSADTVMPLLEATVGKMPPHAHLGYRPITTGRKYRQARSVKSFRFLTTFGVSVVNSFHYFLTIYKTKQSISSHRQISDLFSTALRYTNTSHNENFCSRRTSETITLSQKSVMKSDTALTPQCLLCRTELHNTCYHVFFLAVGCKYKYPLPTLLMGFHLTHTNPHICT